LRSARSTQDLPLKPPIGVFGGTFDPIHLGHLRPALEILEGVGLEEVRFIPCRVPPHRGEPHASPEQRWAMLHAAVWDQPGFCPDDRELRRDGPSYMVDTLASLRTERGETPLCLILGVDALLGLPTWHRWRELVELAHLIVMTRPGWVFQEQGELGDFVAKRQIGHPADLRTRPAGRIVFQAVTPLDISATAIRGLIAKGRSPRYLLPDAVWREIQQQRLYLE
jgi:nicotinate-nucleotide adenylyltransferase